ncbi:MAG: radical SAM protein [Thermoanaerobaculia bacterium]
MEPSLNRARQWGSLPLFRGLRSLFEPIPREKQRLLASRWHELEPTLRRAGQGFGRQSTGCGATIGAMPRCDFDCQGCYLGTDANQVPRLPLSEVLQQIDKLRSFLGPKGNLQLTDGEVTLLPEDELIAMIRHARQVGLIPMVMTHGDTFLRKPGLLPRLVSEGGLTEVSIHVDSLQQGRRGEHGQARGELDLMPLREEMAELILDVRRRTGVRLRAATTLTVTRDTLPDIAAVVRWAIVRSDVFGLISFQPLARVGRTREGLRGVTQEELWRAIEEALAPYGHDGGARSPLQLGHPECTRLESFAVVSRPGRDLQVRSIVRAGSDEDEAVVEAYFGLGLGGVSFRDDPPLVRVLRAAGLFLRAPGWFLGPVRRWVSGRAEELGSSLPRMAWDAARGKIRLRSLMVVSHHFMDAAEIAVDKGRERLDACVFRVPVGERMVPMCQVNAGGFRRRVYAGSSRGAPIAGSANASGGAKFGGELPEHVD